MVMVMVRLIGSNKDAALIFYYTAMHLILLYHKSFYIGSTLILKNVK